MDEPCPDGQSAFIDIVQDSIHGMVTHKGPGAVGRRSGNTRLLHFLHENLDGKRGKIGGRSSLHDGSIAGLVSIVIGNRGIIDIEGHSLQADPGASACLTQGYDHVGLNSADRLDRLIDGLTENGGQSPGDHLYPIKALER